MPTGSARRRARGHTIASRSKARANRAARGPRAALLQGAPAGQQRPRQRAQRGVPNLISYHAGPPR
eukprot:5489588-Lingulodinium_polyedra.AAC.1